MIRFFKSDQGLIGAQVLPPLKGEDKVINGVFQFFSLMSLQTSGRIGRGGLRIVVKGLLLRMTAHSVWLILAIWDCWGGSCSLSEWIHFSNLYFNSQETEGALFGEYINEPKSPEPEGSGDTYIEFPGEYLEDSDSEVD